MFKKIVFITTCLITSGCMSLSHDVQPFFHSAAGYKVDCGNGKRMMTYELCRLDAFGY